MMRKIAVLERLVQRLVLSADTASMEVVYWPKLAGRKHHRPRWVSGLPYRLRVAPAQYPPPLPTG